MTVLQDEHGIPATITKISSYWSCFSLASDFSSHESEEMGLGSQSGGEQVEMACLCSLQTAKCTQCSGQDREHGIWKRAAVLIFGASRESCGA